MGSVFPMITAFKVPTSLLDTFCYCHSLTKKKGKKIKRKDERLNNMVKLPA